MSLLLGSIFLALLVAVAVAVATRRRRSQRDIGQRAAFIASYRFPAELDRRLARRLPQLDPGQRSLVLEGLRQYFLVALNAQQGRIARYLGMPSKAVDEAWHEFIVMTRDYEAFCRGAFGRFLHHRPASQMQEHARDALANTLHQLKRDAPHGGAWAMVAGVPLLFALDQQLAIAGGHEHGAAALAELEARRNALVSSGAEASHTGSSRDDDDAPADADGSGGGSPDGGGGDGGGGGCGSS